MFISTHALGFYVTWKFQAATDCPFFRIPSRTSSWVVRKVGFYLLTLETFYYLELLWETTINHTIVSLTYHRVTRLIYLTGFQIACCCLNTVSPQTMRTVNIQSVQKNGYRFSRHFHRAVSLMLWTRCWNLSKVPFVVEREFVHFSRVATLSGQRKLDCVKARMALFCF